MVTDHQDQKTLNMRHPCPQCRGTNTFLKKKYHLLYVDCYACGHKAMVSPNYPPDNYVYTMFRKCDGCGKENIMRAKRVGTTPTFVLAECDLCNHTWFCQEIADLVLKVPSLAQ